MKRFLLLIFILSQIAIPQRRFVDAYTENNKRDGLSWSTAWKSFEDFDINGLAKVPNGTKIKIAPGEYNTGHSTYYNTDDDTRCIIWIKDNRDLKLILGDPSLAEEDDNVSDRLEPAVFKGSAEYKRGILILPTNIDHSMSNILIRGLRFKDFGLNPFKCRGFFTTSSTNYVKNVKLENCVFVCTSGVSGRNTAAVMFQYTDIAIVERSSITSAASDRTQNDGIYIDDTKNITINNNSITVNNSFAGPDNLQPHVDCIQITRSNDDEPDPGPGCENVTVYNNYLYNESNRVGELYSHRQCLYVLFTTRYIRLYNNIIRSKKGSGLLHAFYKIGTSELSIYNNTLCAESNQPGIMLINNHHNQFGDIGKVKIKNNNVTAGEINNSVLNNNLYYVNSYQYQDYKTAFDKHDPNRPPGEEYYDYNTEPWNGTTPFSWEKNGKIGNPEFESISTGDLRIKYHSQAKNRGVGLKDEGITEDYYGNSRTYWNRDYDIDAFEIEDTQLKIGVEGGASSTRRIFSLTALGTYWEKQGVYWNISTDQSLQSIDYEQRGFNSDLDTTTWFGFEYKWLLQQQGQLQHPKIGSGFYKFSVFEEIDEQITEVKHFYLDLRDAVTEYSPNIYIKYIAPLNRLQYLYNDVWLPSNSSVNNGEILRIWDIRSGQPQTSNLYQYWSKCLIPLVENDHPRLVWGRYNPPGFAGYRIQWRYSGLPNWNIYTPGPGSNDYHKTLLNKDIVSSGGNIEEYLIEVIGASEYSNIVDYRIGGTIIGKESLKPVEYSLNQNFPNPFNPYTISFSLAEKQYVKLKLYDLTGREIKTLLSSGMNRELIILNLTDQICHPEYISTGLQPGTLVNQKNYKF
jgi:hypothetical protein